MKTVVVNTSPLLVLDRIDCIHLLPALFGHVIRPQSVVDEIKAGHNKYGVSDRIIGPDASGTLGVPLVAVKKGFIADFDRVLDDLKRTGFRMSDSLIKSVKEKAHKY